MRGKIFFAETQALCDFVNNNTETFVFNKNIEEGETMTKVTKLERDFQRNLVKELKERFPGCIVTKLDSSLRQGIPDLLILYENKWATLECKKHANAAHRPNQNYYVDLMNKMSFSRFIYPENKEEVLNELSQSFRS